MEINIQEIVYPNYYHLGELFFILFQLNWLSFSLKLFFFETYLVGPITSRMIINWEYYLFFTFENKIYIYYYTNTQQ